MAELKDGTAAQRDSAWRTAMRHVAYSTFRGEATQTEVLLTLPRLVVSMSRT